MQMRKSVRASVMTFIAALIFATDAVSQPPSDESGTLVMIARTSSEIIISVDSKITHLNFQGPQAPSFKEIDGDRKLFNVGMNGACAIDGYLGDSAQDVSAYIREWLKKNPSVGVQEGLESLLKAAATTWNDHHYDQSPAFLPDKRQVGDHVTFLTCGDWVDGHPTIFRGTTYVAPDATAAWKLLPPESGDIFYISGLKFSHPKDFDRFLLYGFAEPEFEEPRAELKKDQNFMEADKERFIADNRIAYALLKDPSTYVPSTWEESSAKRLFVAVFAVFEKKPFDDDVAPPNNVRLIGACGRLETTLEREIWPACPAPAQLKKKP